MTEPNSAELECVEVIITVESSDWLADFTRSLVEDRVTV